jgi:hypothetical protein
MLELRRYLVSNQLLLLPVSNRHLSFLISADIAVCRSTRHLIGKYKKYRNSHWNRVNVLFLTCLIPINSIFYGFHMNFRFPLAILDLWLAVGILILCHIIHKPYLENVTKDQGISVCSSKFRNDSENIGLGVFYPSCTSGGFMTHVNSLLITIISHSKNKIIKNSLRQKSDLRTVVI